MAEVVQCLPSKCKALSSNTSTAKKNKRDIYIHLYTYSGPTPRDPDLTALGLDLGTGIF
jgi:hypothetical protein